MLLVNLAGGPGSGKSTMAHFLTYRCKKAGFRTEFVGEAARELIYSHVPGVVAPPLLDNQLLMAGLQYERILRLKRHGIEIAISDSPVKQNMMYIGDVTYKEALLDAGDHLEDDFYTLNVFVHRTVGTYDPESRVQKTEAEAMAFDREVLKLLYPIHIHANWNTEEDVANYVINKAEDLR